ncbi:MAG: hypothetical protein EOM50_22285 [Erysipelotrichia bacterium]|nr:hypothetical protein [Erysipelotrichia bacterium]
MIPKFRAFLKDTNEIVDVENIFFELCVVKLTNNEFYEFEDIILMQSTGLHDKNGVEMFEGDIVEHLDFNSNEISKSEVRILKGCFYLVISVDGFKYDVPMMDLKDDECILEIKGNVHENTELLEDV